MRQPLAAMMRIANALIQCVTRTTSGWTFTHCACAASIVASARRLTPRWSEGTGYTLQRLPSIAFAKAQERCGKSPPERNHLEEFSHLRRAHQPVRLIGERQEPGPVLGRRPRHHLRDAAVDEELRLAGIAEQLQSARARRRRDRAEIDVAGDVLEPRKEEGIGVRVMAVMAHERPVLALRMVKLLFREAVIDEKRRALFQHARKRAHEASRCQLNLGAKTLWKLERARRIERPARGEPPGPVEAIASHADAAFLDPSALGANHVHGHRIQHLVA